MTDATIRNVRMRWNNDSLIDMGFARCNNQGEDNRSRMKRIRCGVGTVLRVSDGVGLLVSLLENSGAVKGGIYFTSSIFFISSFPPDWRTAK